MTVIELKFLDWIQESLRTPLGDFLMPIISFTGDHGMIWILLAMILIYLPKDRKVGISMGIGLIFMVITCNIILKNWIARVRPFDIQTTILLLIQKPKDFSFPSGHTTASFVAITVLFLYQHKWWRFFLIWGSLIAFSRLYLYVHFPSDIIGGILLGIILGWLAVKLVNYFYQKQNSLESMGE